VIPFSLYKPARRLVLGCWLVLVVIVDFGRPAERRPTIGDASVPLLLIPSKEQRTLHASAARHEVEVEDAVVLFEGDDERLRPVLDAAGPGDPGAPTVPLLARWHREPAR
jgi:hypothetical protein